MERPENNKWLDKVLSETIGSKKPQADFENFKRKHPRAVEMLTSRAGTHAASRAPQTIRNIIMKSQITKFAAAAVLIIAVFIGVRYFGGSIDGASLAFSQVLDNLASVQTIHAEICSDGKEIEIWAKRPDMIRYEHDGGTYEVSNGPSMWVVDLQNNKAVKKPSPYFEDAERRGIDVLDALIRMEYTDNFSGFFSEGPVGKIEKEGKSFDLYQMEIDDHGTIIQFESLVDTETHLINSIKIELFEDGEMSQSFELSILEYNQPMPDSMFAFEPDENMEVVIEEPKELIQEEIQTEGSTLSGRITWASNDKPVSGARLTLSGGPVIRTSEGQNRRSFFARAETDNDGYWYITGAPAGGISMSVRSWEFEWPAMPSFSTNVGSALRPTVVVDGQSEYNDLNFTVYKPEELYAHITINVTDENGQPVEGASAILQYAEEPWSMHQHVYAIPRKRQFSGADGKFDNPDIWPTDRPVKLFVGPRNNDGPYPVRSYGTEPFIIEPKQNYEMNIVLPFKRELTVKVVDISGQPMEGVGVSVLDEDAAPVPQSGMNNMVLSNSQGLADISGLFPGENIIIFLKRLDPTQPDPREPLASAFIHSVAPLELDKPVVEVKFNNNPINIQGSLSPGSIVDSGIVYIMITGEPGENSMMVLRAPIDEDHLFSIKGVPAGRIRLAYSARIDHNNKRDEGWITTEPGNTYSVAFTDNGLQLIE